MRTHQDTARGAPLRLAFPRRERLAVPRGERHFRMNLVHAVAEFVMALQRAVR
jgi:hypothetical protein